MMYTPGPPRIFAPPRGGSFISISIGQDARDDADVPQVAHLTKGLPRWLTNLPFLILHVACISVFWTGVTPLALGLCFGLYFIRMFGITAGYHRYFSHRAYKTSRVVQFLIAWLGCSALQKGPLWWASHHRHHHRHSDTRDDVHSPYNPSFWWSHLGWVLSGHYEHTDYKAIHDFARYPELRWLNRYHWIPGLLLAVFCYLVDGWAGVAWGWVVSTVLLYHGTFTVNSLCHFFGKRRYATDDDSRNNVFVALITLGEGWHNNHHHYQSSANQGFFWWELDISYYLLRGMEKVGLVWDLRTPPESAVTGPRTNQPWQQQKQESATAAK
jgi:stearoyl-CoA desaturase (delta-9 desaturase)